MYQKEKNGINIYIVFICIAFSFYTNFIGYIYIGEIIGLFYVFFQWPKLEPSIKKGLNLIILWAVVQFISDVINKTPLDVSIKGVTAPILLIITTIYFYDYFLKKKNAIASFYIGITIGLTLVSIIFQFEFFMGNPWKWGIGFSVNTMFAIWFSYFSTSKKQNIILIWFTLLFFAFSNIVSARSLGGTTLFATLIFIALQKKYINNYLKSVVLSQYGMLKITLTCIASILFLNLVFTSIFSSEFYLSRLEGEVKDKATMQANVEGGILVAGRTEMLISAKAFWDKPFFGHGSWAKDDGNYIDKYVEITDNLGLAEGGDGGANYAYSLGLIPTHSHIMGALVWGGICASFFWLYILGKIIKMFFLYGDRLNYFSILLFINLFWNILFSPFGYDHRWSTATVLAFLFYYEYYLSTSADKKEKNV